MTHHPTTLRELRELAQTTRLQAGNSTHIEWKRVLNAAAALEAARECPYCQPCVVCGGRGRGVREDAPIGDILRAHALLKQDEEECWQEVEESPRKVTRHRWKVALPFVVVGALSLAPLAVEQSLMAAGAAVCGAIALGCFTYVYRVMEGR